MEIKQEKAGYLQIKTNTGPEKGAAFILWAQWS